jgi:hypothetical protein
MSTLDILKEFEKNAFSFLRRDGLFVKGVVAGEDQMLLENITYVTDTDDGKDIDCLVVHEDDIGLGGSCVCEGITSGQWLDQGSEAPRGCVACPMCQRLARPWKLQKRCYSVMVKVNSNHLTLLNLHPNASLKPMPVPMSEKIIDMCNILFPEWSSSVA